MHVGKYVSFEEQINESKDYYYSALEESSEGWHTNENSYSEFMKNFLLTLYKCYKELDKRFFTVNGKRLSKSVVKLGQARATKYVNARYLKKE